MTDRRDLRREHQLLAAANRGQPGRFIEHAEERLAAGEAVYGDSWAFAGIRRLLTEMQEEAADLGSWSVLADQALDLEELTDLHRDQIRAVLALAAHRGAQAHAALSRALASIPAREEVAR